MLSVFWSHVDARASTLGAPFAALYHPARAFLLRRGLYLLLAFDAWLVMLEHGGRYGAGNFNVGHFAWIDQLIGVPSPALYVGLLITAGLLALMLVFVRATLLARLLLAGVYTVSWSISLHDSYQHHYLLSWLLAWSAFIPDPPFFACAPEGALRRAELSNAEASPLRPAVGLTLTAFTCAIVYVFTALSKSSPEWQSGAVLSRLIQASSARPDANPLAVLRDALSGFLSVPGLQILAWFARSLVVLQIVVALAYALTPGRDESSLKAGTTRARLRAVLCGAGLACAVSFHWGAEFAGLFEIGWFSYYMLWVAFVLLSPASWVAWPARWLARSIGQLARFLGQDDPTLARAPEGGLRPKARAALYVVALGALFMLCGAALDLPGATTACAIMVGLLALALACCALRGRPGELEQWTLSAVFACVCLWCAITLTPVRFDFYRRWAGEVSRLGELDLALALYRKAEKYAPPGASRARQIEHLERQLGRSAPSGARAKPR